MSAASTETSAPLPTAGSRVFFQAATGVGCVGSGPITGDDPVQKKQGKVTVKYDRKELRKRLVLEEWIIEQLSELYDCEVSGAEILNHTRSVRALVTDTLKPILGRQVDNDECSLQNGTQGNWS